MDGELALRSAGFLIGWSGATGETRLHNARNGHPADIPGHDYASSYGKLTYRSGFPFDLRAGPSGPGPDATVILSGGAGVAVGHRNVSLAGGAGPGWIWSRYQLPLEPRPANATTVLLTAGEIEIRVTRLRPRSAVRAIAGPASLGAAGPASVVRRSDQDAGWEYAEAGGRAVAIRRLVGFDAQQPSRPYDGRESLNLVHQHAELPVVFERNSSLRHRIVAEASLARSGAFDAGSELGSVWAEVAGECAVRIAWPGWIAALCLGGLPQRVLRIGEWRVRGPAVTIARAATDGRAFGGELLTEIDGVLRLDAPGPIAVRDTGSAIEVDVVGGIAIEPTWAGRPLRNLSARAPLGDWHPVGGLETEGVVPRSTVRKLAGRWGTRFVSLRLEP